MDEVTWATSTRPEPMLAELKRQGMELTARKARLFLCGYYRRWGNTVDEVFLNADVTGVFEGREMSAKVAVRCPDDRFEPGELDLPTHRQEGS